MIGYTECRTHEQLKEQGFGDRDIKLFDKLKSRYFGKMLLLDEATTAKDYDTVVELEELTEILELDLRYRGLNPKEIPLDALRRLTQSGVLSKVEDSVVLQYRRRIKNPATAIRAFCMKCMGGAMAEVRRCEAMNCPLWSFRMGTNPFANKVLPPVEQVIEIEEDEVVEIDESQDEGDDAN